jgi:putative heme-binding domain-containing protein
VRNEVLRYFRDAPDPLTADELAWVRRWRTAPDPGATVTGWNRDYLAPGGPYERAFQNLLVQMVEEKGHRRPAAVSSEWAADLRTAPPKPPEERARISERITRLTQVVNASPQADIAGGESLFRGTCGVCHATSQRGSGFGPSLAGSRDRATNAILTAVLDPDRAVESVFRTFHVETKDGSVYDGFFGDETAEAVVIRLAGGTNLVVPKDSIKEAGYIEGSSVMPTGLFDALSDEQVINVVRYVQSLR